MPEDDLRHIRRELPFRGRGYEIIFKVLICIRKRKENNMEVTSLNSIR
jgi:hypothetical protein